MPKGVQTNIRLDSKTHSILLDIASQSNLTLSALTTKIILDYIGFYHYKQQRGDVTISQPVLKKWIENIDPKSIDDIAEFNANFMVQQTRAQVGKITCDIFLERSIKWNEMNHLSFNKIEQKESDLLVSYHSLGQKWSELQCKTYVKALEIIGQTVITKEYDFDDFYSLEVANHQHRRSEENNNPKNNKRK